MSAIVTYDLTKKVNKRTFGTVVVNRIDNPFDPLGSKVTKTDLHGSTLDKYLDGYCLGANLLVSINGKLVEVPFEEYTVQPNDVITYTPIIEGGGGGGKQIMSMVAMIALTIVAPMAGAYFAGGSGAVFGATTLASLSGMAFATGLMYTAGIMIAGSLLINAVLGPGTSGSIVANTIETESSTYSWNGIQTSRDLNKPIPVLYGTHALGGTVINSRFYYKDTDDWIGTQLALCHGEIEEITSDNIKVNDSKYSSYVTQGDTTNGWFQYRQGTFDQSIMTGYSDSNYNNGAVSREVKYNVPYTFVTESTNIDFFRLHFEFPNGLYGIDTSSGSKYYKTVILNAKYRKVGTSTWYNMYNWDTRGVKEYKYTYETVTSYNGLGDDSGYHIYTPGEMWSTSLNATPPDGVIEFTRTSEFRYNTNIEFVPTIDLEFTSKSSVALKKYFEPVDVKGNPIVLELGQYEVQVTRITADEAEGDSYNQSASHVRFIEEINTADINYGGIALLGVDLKATDQLSNSRPNFVTTCTRKPLFINGMYRDSTNPAWICADILTNQHYGMGLDITEIDNNTFEQWAAFCDGGIATTFILAKTIPAPIVGQHIIGNSLLIPFTDLPEGQFIQSLNQLNKGNSTLTATVAFNSNNALVNTSVTDEHIVSISTYYSSGDILAQGYYYKLNFAYNLTTEPISYSLVFKDAVSTVTPKLKFNGLFDTSSDIWTALQDIAQVGRGQVILRGNKYSCIYDDIKPIRGLFNAANSKNTTIQYLSNADIATEIEVQFSDKNIDYEMNSISVQDASAMASGVRSNKTTKQVKGITSEEEALVYGKYLLASSKFLRRMVTLDADIESITATVGDLIAVQTDVTQYGTGGLVLQKLGNAIILDNMVQLEYGKEYTLKIKNNLTDDIQDYTFIPNASAQADYTFNDSAGLTLGVLKFNDFDLVVNEENGQFLYTNTLLMPEGYQINAEDRYSFGGLNSDSILCTILDIDRSGDLSRRITAIEYNESILDFNYDNDMVQRLEPTGKVKNEITGFNASDRLVKLDAGQVVASVSFGWTGKVRSAYNIFLLEEGGFKHYLGNNIKETRYEYANTVMLPEVPYTIYIEDALDMSIISSMVYTITSFSSAPEDITSVFLTTFDANVEFTISYPNKPLDFAYYNVYKNSTLISTQISDKFSIRHTAGLNSVTYSIEAVDMIKKKSQLISTVFTPVAPIINSVDYLTEGENIKLSITATKGSFDIDFYTITYDATSIQVRELTALVKANYTGVKEFSIKAQDVLGNISNVYLKDISISVPQPVGITGTIEGKEVVISWGIPNSSIAIDYYEVTYNSHIIKTKTSSYRVPVSWNGSKTFSVKTVNILGAMSTAVSTSITISTGIVTQLQTEVIDNNVLLRWSALQGSLPIENFLLYKGVDINNLTLIGEKKGTFTTIFENESGLYTYWLGAIDSAGNLGTLVSATTQVAEPPDYVLNVNWVSALTGTVSNAKLSSLGVVLPINNIETIQQHFVNNSWSTPQNQIDSGNPLWIQPFVASGYYQEVFDYGTTLASSLITVNLDYVNVVGTPTVSTTVSISTNGTTWTDYVGQLQVYGTGFRYVKVKVTVSGSNQGLLLKGLEVKLDSKIKNDSGTGVAVSTDVGGTVVNFNKPFVDITSISVTPSGTTPMYAIYDFVDIANPTQFKVLLYNSSGVRINGNFSWSARGY